MIYQNTMITYNILSAIAKDITQFVSSTGLWANNHIEQIAGNQDFITYWQALKKCNPLAYLAIKILLMPSTSAEEHLALEASPTGNFEIF